MNVIFPSIVGFLGVVVGGFISYLSQTKNQIRIEKINYEREQESQMKKDKRQKHIAYNKFLLLEGNSSPLMYPKYRAEEADFVSEVYYEGTRNVLYEDLHLFSKQIVKNVLEIDFIEEEAEVMGPEPFHGQKAYNLYREIKAEIKEDYKEDLHA